MEVIIGKKINLIKLHDFLDRIEVEQVYSTLHTLYGILTAGRKPGEEFEYDGNQYTLDKLLTVMKLEEDVVKKVTLKEQRPTNYEITLNFKAGNGIVIRVKDQMQYLQILQYIMEV